MSAVTDKDLGFDRFMRDLDDLAKGGGVYVGVRQKAGAKPAGERTSDGAVKDSADTTIAQIATYNEFGATIRTGPRAGTKIPERSFLRATVDANEQRYTDTLGKQIGAVIDGNQTPEGALRILGVTAVRDVQMAIRKGVPPPNAPATVKRKGSSKTLIDTGRLRQSIDYQVVMGTTPAGSSPLPDSTPTPPTNKNGRPLSGAALKSHLAKQARLAGGTP